MNNLNSARRNQVQKSPARKNISKQASSHKDIRKCPNGRVPSRRPKIVTVKKKTKSPFPIGFVFSSIVLTSLVLMVMVYFAEINKLSTEMTKINKEIAILEKSERKLGEKLDSRDDIDMIKKRAIEMGMVSSELLDHQYVNLTNDDKTEIIKIKDSKSGFGFMLSGIRELFGDFFEKDN